MNVLILAIMLVLIPALIWFAFFKKPPEEAEETVAESSYEAAPVPEPPLSPEEKPDNSDTPIVKQVTLMEGIKPRKVICPVCDGENECGTAVCVICGSCLKTEEE